MKLEDIGFYTLSDYRASQISSDSPLWRCELIITDKCNFRCPYCRGISVNGHIALEKAKMIISIWAEQGLKNIRFSGGEPTLHPFLINMVLEAKRKGVERVAISTNGSADSSLYWALSDAGVDDFSISLDACCSEDMDKMTGTTEKYKRVTDAIWYISTCLKKYVTIGVVLTNENFKRVRDIVKLCEWLGVSDVRIIPSAQENMFLSNAEAIDQCSLDKFPILKYRVNIIKSGRHVRGLSENDHRCYLVMDDMAVMGDNHYPCIIYLREGGDSIGDIRNPIFRKNRVMWSKTHDTYEDEICRKNCLDVCIDFNRRCHEFGGVNKVAFNTMSKPMPCWMK